VGGNVVDYADLLFAAESNFATWANEDESLRDGWKSIFSLWEARFRLPQIYDWTNAESIRLSMKIILTAGGLDVPETPARGPDAVEIGVDLRDGRVFALRALSGYEGMLFEAVRTGMSGREAREAEPRLRYAEDEGGFVVPGVAGVFILLGPDGYDLDDEDVDQASVDEIWIFDPGRAGGGVLVTWPPEIP
jgi:hypothetical protein